MSEYKAELWVLFKESLNKKKITVSSEVFKYLVERNGELENAVIDLRASLRTCANTSTHVLEQYEDL